MTLKTRIGKLEARKPLAAPSPVQMPPRVSRELWLWLHGYGGKPETLDDTARHWLRGHITNAGNGVMEWLHG